MDLFNFKRVVNYLTVIPGGLRGSKFPFPETQVKWNFGVGKIMLTAYAQWQSTFFFFFLVQNFLNILHTHNCIIGQVDFSGCFLNFDLLGLSTSSSTVPVACDGILNSDSNNNFTNVYDL